jgi:predicted oxidoreductase
MTLSIEQLESWEKEAGIHLDKLQEVDEMIHRKLVDRNLAKRMGTVADDNIQILISKLRDSLEDSDLSEICNILDKIKSKEPVDEIKVELEKTAVDNGCDDMNEMNKSYDGHILMLTMQIIKKLLKPA